MRSMFEIENSGSWLRRLIIITYISVRLRKKLSLLSLFQRNERNISTEIRSEARFGDHTILGVVFSNFHCVCRMLTSGLHVLSSELLIDILRFTRILEHQMLNLFFGKRIITLTLNCFSRFGPWLKFVTGLLSRSFVSIWRLPITTSLHVLKSFF